MRSIREIPIGTRDFILRVIVVPFEIALALTAIWAGFSALLNFSAAAVAFNASLPSWLTTVFNIVYIVSGLGILSGVGWNYRNLEASGLILLVTSLVVRVVALFLVIGLTTITTNVIIQAVCFGGAAFVRLCVLLAKKTTVLVATDHQAVVIESIEEFKNGGG